MEIKSKKQEFWPDWDLNSGPLDGKRVSYHWAMGEVDTWAADNCTLLWSKFPYRCDVNFLPKSVFRNQLFGNTCQGSGKMSRIMATFTMCLSFGSLHPDTLLHM